MFVAGAARIQVSRVEGVFPRMFSYTLYGGAFGAVQMLFLSAEVGPPPMLGTWVDLAPWVLLLCLGFLLPTNAIITSSPKYIGAGLFGILILAELILGTISAAIWANEPFGWHEVSGCLLILTAGAVEVVLAPRAMKQERP